MHVDAGLDRHQQARPAERVAGHRDAGHVGLVDDRLDLLAGEELASRIDLRRADPAGRGDLDDVGAGPQHFADLGAGLVRAVAAWLGMPGSGGETIPWAVVGSAMPLVGETMVRLHWRRGPGIRPAVDRLAEPGVQPAQVAGRRAADLQRRPERGDRLGGQQHQALVLVRDQVHAPVREVGVTVDQAGHDRLARPGRRP